VLRVIGSRDELFSELRRELTKAVPALIEKQLKAIGQDVERVKQINSALGPGTFYTILQILGPAKAATLLKKLDKHHPNHKGKANEWALPHLYALANGECSVAAAPIKSARPKKSKTAHEPSNVELVRTLSATAMSAKRKIE
jgi:hypothetical protein